MPTGNWMSNKAKVMPLNLSCRSAKGNPHSVSKEQDNPPKRRASKPLRHNQ